MIGNEYIELARIMAERKKLEDAYAKALAPDPDFVGPSNPRPKPSNQQPPMPQPVMPSRANEIQPVNVTAQKRPVPGLFEPVEVTAQKKPTFFPSRIGRSMARGGGFQMTEDQKKGIYTPEEEARFRADRNQGIGKMLLGLSDAFAGRPIEQGFMQRQQYEQQQNEIQKKKEQYNALMNDPNTPPETKQLLASLGWQGMDQVLLKQFELDNQPEKTSSLYREYIDAVKSGYQGTFIDYKDRYGLTMTEKLLQEASGVMPSTVDQNNNQSGLVTITTQEEYDALPSGSLFIENGKRYRKP